MVERQRYYENLVEYILEKYAGIHLDRSKTIEAPLPNVRIDMLFEMDEDALQKIAESPLPYLSATNLVHIKAFQDKLTASDVIQYVGEAYIIGTRRNRETSLTIVSAEKIERSVRQVLGKSICLTEYPWIYQIEAFFRAYILVLDELPIENEEYQCFIPFQSLKKIESHKNFLRAVANKQVIQPEEALMLFWLQKLQPDFFNEEIGDMAIDMEEVVKTLCPKTLQNAKIERSREIALEMLKEGMDITQIIKFTKLTEEEVMKIKSEKDKE